MSWETTHEFSTSRLLQLFFYCFLAGAIVATILTVIGFKTDWYQTVIVIAINVHAAHPVIFFVYAFILTIVYVNHRFNQKEKRKKEGKTKK